MKPLVIYHANCADGFGAAFAAWTVLGDEAEYLPMQYGQAFADDLDYGQRDVYILDFSFPREVMNTIFQHAKRVVWLDHHKTAFEMWCPEERERLCWTGEVGEIEGTVWDAHEAPHHIHLNNSKSGALLAWEFFHPGEEVPMLIQHIDDHDRWVFAIEGTKEFNKALWSYAPWSFEQWRDIFLASIFTGETWRVPDEFYIEGAAILRAHEQNVTSAVKHACKCVIQWDWKPVAGTIGFREDIGLAANCPPNLASDVGHQLAIKSGTFGLCWYMDSEQVVRCSLRSNGDYDVSAIAKVFGGGGHRNAAGFSTDIQTLLGWLK